MAVIRREAIESRPNFSFADFENRAAQILADAQRQAQVLLADARARGEKLADQARRDAFAIGLAEGRETGEVQVREQTWSQTLSEKRAAVDALITALSHLLDEFEQRKHNLLAQAESGLIRLAIEIAGRVCKRDIATHGETVANNVRAVLEMVRNDNDVEIRLNPADFSLVEALAADFLEKSGRIQHVRLHADDALNPGACLLRSAAGEIDASIDTQLERVAEALLASRGEAGKG